MEPVHIVTKKENIAPLVLLPGDPLRAQYIAEKFLDKAELVSSVRNMFYYTGYYKGKRITVGGSGMGCPSVGIYAYELYHFYDVEKIIRIGSSGSMRPDIKILDVILSIGAYSESSFAYHWSKNKTRYIPSSMELNTVIADTADRNHMDIKIAPTITSDTFDVWHDIEHILEKCPIREKLGCCEMEGFGLFHVAKTEGRQAAMLATVVDSRFEPDNTVSVEDRQTALNDMIILALDSIIKE